MHPKLILFLACLLIGALLPAQGLELVPDPLPPASSPPSLPAFWRATGKIYDQYNRPVAGARVTTIGAPGPAMPTGSDGSFTLPSINSATRLRISKAEYLTTEVSARELHWFFASENDARTEISLPVLDIRLTVGPEGGTLRGAIDIDVPPGALSERVAIRAAVLPPGYRRRPAGELHPQSYGTVHFEPRGLRFNRPIRIRQPGAAGLQENAAPALARLVETPAGTSWVPVPEAEVAVRGNDWFYSLAHFSEYQLVDSDNLVQSYRPAIEAEDANMDGAVNEQDAERILKLENGPHDFEYVLSFRQTQSIAESRESVSSEESETTTGAGAGADVGGVSLGATMEDRVRRANELAEKFGYDRVRETVRTGTFSLADAEYTTRCDMVFSRYDFRRFKEYRKHQPVEHERARIRESHRANRAAGEEWSHLRVAGSGSVAMNRTLHGGNRLAVREKANGELEVYILRAEYTLRTLKGFGSGACDRYASQPQHRLRYGDYFPLGPDGAESYSMEYRGYRPITEPDERHHDQECGSSYSGEITTRRSQLAFKELTASQARETTADRGVSGGVSVPLPGGITLGGNASLNTSRTRAATAAQNYATNTSESDESTLRFSIRNEHAEHESDHELYRLYHVYEMRDWYYRHPTDPAISESLKQRMRNALNSGRIRGAGRDGKLVLLQMHEGREYWYESGPPIEIVREAGYLLQRVGERPCLEEPPIRDPRPAETTPEEEVSSVPSAAKRRVPRWIPIGGGIVTGGVIYWLTRDDGDCEIQAETFTQPAYCGNANGAAELRISPAGDYRFSWPDGSALASRNNLAAGTYAVRVHSADGECSIDVSVEVPAASSSFTIVTETADANCGANDGAAVATVTESGSFTYRWSEGSEGPELGGLAPGSYTVTVTEDATSCSESRMVTVGTAMPTYLSELVIQQASCNSLPEVRFLLSSPGAGPLTLAITTPEGAISETFPPGPVSLGALVELPPGDYQLRAGTSDACFSTHEFTLNPAPDPPRISLESSTPPSAPSAADGSVTIAVISPGTPPYLILRNGETIGSFTGSIVSVGELGWGDHQFFIRSANGCLSNGVEVSFAQLQTGWTVTGLLAAPGSNLSTTATVEHPAKPAARAPGHGLSRLRLIRRGQRQRTLIDGWIDSENGLTLAVGQEPHWRIGTFRLHTGPGVRLTTGGGASRRYDWRWTASAEYGRPGNENWFFSVDAAIGPRERWWAIGANRRLR